jgi:hypothetical protein
LKTVFSSQMRKRQLFKKCLKISTTFESNALVHCC